MAPVAEGVDQVTSSSGADGSRDEAKMQTMRQQEDEEGGGEGQGVEWDCFRDERRVEYIIRTRYKGVC